MNIRFYLSCAMGLCMSFLVTAFAGAPKDIEEVKYKRSSLHTILMESKHFPMKDTIVEAYNNAPFPDKYNNHTIGYKSFNPWDYPITNEERVAAGIKEVKAKNDSTGSERVADLPLICDKYLKENHIANKLVAKWFNQSENGAFDMGLISERGFYNATEMEANVAKESVRGTAMLADAGEGLISNTFVVISRLKFVKNEITAAAVREAAYIAADNMPNELAAQIARTAADVVYNTTKDGYSVWTISRLYKLKWNDSIAAVFYTQHWMGANNVDPARKAAFDSSSVYEMEFIGEQEAKSLVLFGTKPADEILKTATIRNVDKVYSKLQKEYDVFKTKTPLYSVDPITAKIGMKEGLEGKERFEVLEMIKDEVSGKVTYKRKAIITVDKKKLWDNRYNAGEENPEESELGATTFKGPKNLYPGMLIRQIK